MIGYNEDSSAVKIDRNRLSCDSSNREICGHNAGESMGVIHLSHIQYQQHKVSKLNPTGAIQLTVGWELPAGTQAGHNLAAGSRGYGSQSTPLILFSNQHAGTIHQQSVLKCSGSICYEYMQCQQTHATAYNNAHANQHNTTITDQEIITLYMAKQTQLTAST
ncbi:hypothetical protein F511_40112 [Dorcoceras hygrometricum]|uniref:Uncharacterized protein n=1 Tax=Dorcoceras hygrometricum TaxID=472368 RepID=A0A2Z7AGE5_9LAMI|nr:hypothetical protein F511_40112 [Dorcoceras hygrometricum]